MTETLPRPLSDDLVELITRRFRLLAEPMRIRLLDRLRDGEASVHELAEELETTQQNVSKHLAMLADAGILARRREQTHAYYRIADEEVLALCGQVCGSLERRLRGFAPLVAELAALQLEGDRTTTTTGRPERRLPAYPTVKE
jgi:DNA-binding transcriptional ArsR family regulator